MRIRWKRRGAITTALYKGIQFGTITTEKANKGNVYSVCFEEEEKAIRLKNFTNSKATLKSWYIDWIKKNVSKVAETAKEMKRIYHPFHLWEETRMWRKISRDEENELLKRAIEFTGNAKLYGSYMLKAIDQWKYSCEHNLTNISMNRQAWVGHAACCIAIDCPERITRLAWHQLTQRQQDEANHEADIAIALWEFNHRFKQCQNDQLGFPFLKPLNNESLLRSTIFRVYMSAFQVARIPQ